MQELLTINHGKSVFHSNDHYHTYRKLFDAMVNLKIQKPFGCPTHLVFVVQEENTVSRNQLSQCFTCQGMTWETVYSI